MFTKLWGRVTGKDKRKQYPEQQAAFLGRIGDYVIVFPYGLYADLPTETLLKEIAPNTAIPVTVKRPGDTLPAEPVFFHPNTNTRIIARNNGDLDIETTDVGGNVNINTVSANITASDAVAITCSTASIDATASIELTAPNINLTGDVDLAGNFNSTGTMTNSSIDVGSTHRHNQGVDSNGDTQATTSTPV